VDHFLAALWTCVLSHTKSSIGSKEIDLMGARLKPQKVLPAMYKALLGLEMFVRTNGTDIAFRLVRGE
jgi:hypothetical protein